MKFLALLVATVAATAGDDWDTCITADSTCTNTGYKCCATAVATGASGTTAGELCVDDTLVGALKVVDAGAPDATKQGNTFDCTVADADAASRVVASVAAIAATSYLLA